MCRISMVNITPCIRFLKKIPEVKTPSIGTDKPLQTVKTQISIICYTFSYYSGGVLCFHVGNPRVVRSSDRISLQ